jgi:hypothetical protein
MAAITFPASPTLNQTHTVGDRSWKFNGTAWKLVPRTTDAIVEGSSNLFFTESRVRATVLTGLTPTDVVIDQADSVLGAVGKAQGQITALDSRMDTAESDITALESSITAIGSAFNYVGTLAGGADAANATNLAALAENDPGDYYKVATAGYFILAPASAFYANVNDGIVFNNASGVDKIDSTDSTVAGTSNYVSVSGSTDTGYTVDLDSTFKTRVDNAEGDIDALETGKQIKDVVSTAAPAHSEGLRWIDSADMTEYLSYGGVWVEIDKQ